MHVQCVIHESVQKLGHYHIMLHVLADRRRDDVMTVVLSVELCTAWLDHLSRLEVVGPCNWSAFSVPGTNSMHVAKQETSVQCRWMQQLPRSNIHSAIESVQLRLSTRQGQSRPGWAVQYLKGEDMAAIDDILHRLLEVLHAGIGEDNGELGCASSRDDLYRHNCW